MDSSPWLASPDTLLLICSKGVAGYLLLIVFVRLSGKRSTSKMNNFDWIVTVAVGSVFASTVLLDDVSLLGGAFAMALLVALQFLLTLATSRSEAVRRAVLAPPALLFFRGEFLTQAMRRERVSHQEIVAAIRESGHADCDGCAVVLESNADLSVLSVDRAADQVPALSFVDS